MKSSVIFEGINHKWIVFGRDVDKPDNIIDTNQYLLVDGDRSLILDPGGIEVFAPMLASVLKYTTIESIQDLFASHQDPDIISSLGFWDKAVPNAKLHAPYIWEGFLRHFGCDNITYMPIQDEGGTLQLNNAEIEFIPAHYLHSSGNFNVYDREAKFLMSGDIGAALEEPGAPMFVEDFDAHIKNMDFFHRRWMPSNKAKNDWVRRVRELDIEIMAPQHGSLFKGENVKRFLDWFESIDVGTAI